jgi:hypothetical protein
MKTILLICILLIGYNLNYGQKIILAAKEYTTDNKLNVDVTITNNTSKTVHITPLNLSCDNATNNRYWKIVLLHDKYTYRVYDLDENIPGYAGEKVRFKNVKPNSDFKFTICIDFTKVQIQIQQTENINNIQEYDSLYTKFGYDKNVKKNVDYGKYSLTLKYVFLSDENDKNLSLTSNSIDIQYKDK